LGVVENDATGTWRPGDTRARPVGADATELNVLLELLARALGLERAALLVEQTAGGIQVPVATWGAVRLPSLDPASEPPNGPWSAVLVLESSGRPFGRALLAAPGGRSLPPQARALASKLVDGASALLARTQLEHDLVHARELLARADRLAVLGTLAAGVAHEVRNPLVSVRTFIELLPERLHDEEFRTSFRDLTLAEIERICALLNDLLAFARPAPGQAEASDLNALVVQTVRLLEPEGRKCGVSLSTRCAAALPPVAVEEGRLKQVLMNVILNAIQASAGRGAVEISTQQSRPPDEGWSIVEVVDSGPGIPPELAPHIFDPFVTTKETGSGLGLHVAQRIASDHGGAIRARSGPDGGTIFAIHLPTVAVERDVGTG
jgi:signal transduction histidine kinase